MFNGKPGRVFFEFLAGPKVDAALMMFESGGNGKIEKSYDSWNMRTNYCSTHKYDGKPILVDYSW